MTKARLIESVLIVLNGRTKVIQLPCPTDPALLKVKYGTSSGLVELTPKAEGPVDLSILRRAADRRRETSRKNVALAQEALAQQRKEATEVTAGLMAKLSPSQRTYLERLFDLLRFKDGDGWAKAAGKWVLSLMECAPEPWRLDFYFLKKWMASPYTAANITDDELTKGDKKKSPLMIRRAVALKQFISAWEEQIGPTNVPPDISGLKMVRGAVSSQDSHPFTVIYTRLQEGRFPNREALVAAIREYSDAGMLRDSELQEAGRMLDSGKWMGDLPLPGV